MAADDPKDSEELQRKQTLEEIRRRAEEAELKRIEEMEKQAGDAPTRTPDRAAPEELRRRAELEENKRIVQEEPPAPPVAPPPNVEPAPVPPPPPVESELDKLRKKLTIALDRGRFEKASALFADYSDMDPDEDELEEFQLRLKALESEQLRAKRKKKAPEGPTAAEREASQKKIKELLETANSFYQQEKYQRGLDAIQDILNLDEKNDDALALRDQIQKSQQLAERIKEEEAKRKAELPETPVPPVIPVVTPQGEDIWGGGTVVPGDASYEPPDFSTPPPPPVPRIVKIADRLSRIRIPRKVVTGIIVAIAIAAAGYIVYTISQQALRSEMSLLVFPAEVVESDTSARFLADGIMHGVIVELASASQLRVVAPMTSLALQGGILAARTVSANHYVHTRMVRSANTLAVEVALFDTSGSESLWRLQVSRPLEEVMSLQHDIARGLLGALNAKPAAGARPEEAVAVKPAAFEEYARGQAMLLRPRTYSLATTGAAFAASLQVDPRFSKAWASLGWTHVLMYEAESEPAVAHLDTAWQAAQQALVGGLKSADVFRLMGVVEQYRGQYDEALSYLENAISLAPRDAESQHRIAELYAIRGRTDEALQASRRAALDDPLNIGTLTTFGLIQQFTADYRGAMATYEAASRLASDPDYYKSGYYLDVLVYLNKPEHAVEVLQDRILRMPESFMDHYKLGRVYQSAGGSRQQWGNALEKARDLIEATLKNNQRDGRAHSLLALVRMRLGRHTEALISKNQALEISPTDPDVLMNIARMHAIHRDKKEALEYLGRSLDQHYRFAPLLDMDFFNIRSDPDFLAAIKR